MAHPHQPFPAGVFEIKEELEDGSLTYPSYYTRAFHGGLGAMSGGSSAWPDWLVTWQPVHLVPSRAVTRAWGAVRQGLRGLPASSAPRVRGQLAPYAQHCRV